METAKEVIEDALQEILVQAIEQPVLPVDFNKAARYMNRMMAEFEADGIVLGYINVDSANDEITIPDGAINGLIYNLALSLAGSYGVALKPDLAIKAKECKETMVKLSVNIPSTDLPETLPVGSGNEGNSTFRNNFYSIEE